jgi:hypothetical protein
MSIAKATTERPPLPPFTRETAIERFAGQKMPGTLVIRKRWPWLTRLTQAGETARNL